MIMDTIPMRKSSRFRASMVSLLLFTVRNLADNSFPRFKDSGLRLIRTSKKTRISSLKYSSVRVRVAYISNSRMERCKTQ